MRTQWVVLLYCRHAGLFLLCSLVARFACAQDLTGLSLDQLQNIEVVTASRFTQKVSEAPSSVTVITAEEIEIHGYRTLADLLRSLRGVVVTYDRNYSYLGTRGSGRPGDFNSRILLLVDGQRLNDMVYDQAPIGTEFPIDMALIERVEYVPGPGSAIYGSSAFFGVINLITKKGRSLAGFDTALQAGSGRTSAGRFSYGQRFDNGDDLLLSGSGFYRAGKDVYFPEFDSAASNHGVASGLDDDRYHRLFAKYTHADLTLEWIFGERSKGVPTASYGQQFNDPRSRSVDRYLAGSATYQRALSATVDVVASINVSQYLYTSDAVLGPPSTAVASVGTPATINRDVGDSVALRADIRMLNRSYHAHKLIYGVELFDAMRRQQRVFNIAPYAAGLDVNHPKRGYALYGQDEWHVTNAVIVNAGLRHDHDSEGGNADSPRLGLIYKLTPDLTTKLLYGTAFRSPNAYERYYVDQASSYKSVPGLTPEKISTREMVIEYYPRPDFRSSMSLFAYRMTHLISLSTDPHDGLLFYGNADAGSSRGIELEADHIGQDGSRLKGSISFQRAQNDIDGSWLTNSPRALVKLDYSYPLPGCATRIGLEAQYTSRRKTVLGTEIGAFAVINATLARHKLAPGLELSASIYNVLGKRYADPPSEEHFDNSTPPRYLQSIGQDGRVWHIDLRYRF